MKKKKKVEKIIKLNRFDQLVEDLEKGNLSWNQVQIALRVANDQGGFAKEIKDIENQFIYTAFKLITTTLGSMELIYRRAYQAGEQDFEKTEFGQGVKDLWEDKELGEVELAKSFRQLWEKDGEEETKP